MESNQVIAEGVPPEEGKFCADCKHLIGVRHNQNERNNWNCGHPNNDLGMGEADRITGIKTRRFKTNIYELRYTSSIDPTVCGPHGTWYEKYEPPNLVEDRPNIGGDLGSELVFDDAAAEAGAAAAKQRLADLKRKAK